MNREYLEYLVAADITGASTHQENDFGLLLEPKLRKVFYDTYKELPEQYSKIFNVKSSKKAKETDYGVGAFRPWEQFGKSFSTVADADKMPTVKYQKIHPGLERTYIHEEFASGFMVERKFVDDEMYNIIEKLPKDLARAGRYKVETDACSIFNDSLKATPTKTIYDGKALFAHDHPLIETTSIKGDNLIDGELSDQKLKDALLLGRKQRDEAGKLIVTSYDTLVVPPSLEWLAMELTKTTGKPGTDLNDINVLKGRLNIIVWDFLENDKSCFIMDSKNHEANFFWRCKPEFNREKDFDSFVSKYNGYMRYSFGFSDWRGFIGIKPNA